MKKREREKKYFTLKKLTALTLEQQLLIREVRNEVGIRSVMYTEQEIGLNEHLQWVNRLKSDKKQIVFGVLNEKNNPIGAVSVNSLDILHKKADWEFYLDKNERGGLGAALEYNLIEYVFNVLGIEKLNCEVIETNETVVKLHKKFFFTEEGFRKENIEKNGKRIGVYFLGLTKTNWLANKKEILKKYKTILEKFSIKFEHSA
jgi:UDP-4-amino-4,6-dideoxy-N-acetyl-beta-L-altrosamine N-acetyltransferase